MKKSEKIKLVKKLIKKGYLFEVQVACLELGIDYEEVRKGLKNENQESK